MNAIPGDGRGFTFIEILLLVGIVSILVSIVVIALRPALPDSGYRDAQRRQDVQLIMAAIKQYQVANDGALPGYLSGATIGAAYEICACTTIMCPSASVCGLHTNMINLSALSGSYLPVIPMEPLQEENATGAQYDIHRDSETKFRVCAPFTERSTDDICVSN